MAPTRTGAPTGARTRPRAPAATTALAAVLRPPLHAVAGRRWTGAHYLPDGPFVAVANHVSNLDPLLVGDFLLAHGAPPSFLAKSELFSRPGVARLLRAAGQIEVRRGTDQARAALDAGRSVIDAGGCVVVFPEGTFTRDADLWPMTGRPGAARLALATGVPVVPIVCWGGQRVLPPFTSALRPLPRVTVDVVAGRPMTEDDLVAGAEEGAAPEALARHATVRILDRLTAMLAVVRGETPPGRRWDMRTDGGRPLPDAARPARTAGPGTGRPRRVSRRSRCR